MVTLLQDMKQERIVNFVSILSSTVILPYKGASSGKLGESFLLPGNNEQKLVHLIFFSILICFIDTNWGGCPQKTGLLTNSDTKNIFNIMSRKESI